jgi:hypothetical protein
VAQQFNIDAYVDCSNNISSVIIDRNINGIAQSSLTMYDDGTHGDTIANDKIYTCQVPGLNIADALITTIKITDQNSNLGVYAGPVIGGVHLIGSTDSVLIDVNRFKLPVSNNGILADVLISGQPMAGGFYDGRVILYSDGFLMSGISNGILWANGASPLIRAQDYLPGKVGTVPQDPKNIIYVIRSDDPPFGLSWQNWKYAVSQGADYYDGNHDGIYNPVDLNGNGKWDPNEDRPDLLGNITAWCVYNDGVPSDQRVYNDVIPQGIEIQQTVFAQKDSADLNNVVFVRYRIINRGIVANVLDSVFFCSTNDIDIGDNGAQDQGGCDTLLNTGYTYHAPNSITLKWGPNPPAEFVTIPQGPLSYIPGITFTDLNANGIYDPGIDTPIDTAYNYRGPLLGKAIFPGAKNLNISSSLKLYGGTDPATKYEARYYLTGKDRQGNYFDPCSWGQGLVWGGVNCANINPLFMYSGDPITQTGWLDNSAEDTYGYLSTGPFKMEKDKPVDIIVANIVARGSDALNSITVAKNYASNIIKYCKSNFPNSILTGIRDISYTVNNFRLDQNYPNPFNPSTKIRYSVKINSLVTIKVYNILGKQVAVLLNENKNPGEYTVDFNAGKFNLSSGVYFYRMTSGSFTSVKKMILLK